MKKLILMVVVAIALTGCMPDNIKPGQEIKFVQVHDVPKTSKGELFSKVEQWFAINYNSSKSVINMKNADSGVIIGRGITSANAGYGVPNTVYYTIKVEVRDGRVRFTGDSFNWVQNGAPISLAATLKDMRAEMASLSRSLSGYVSQPKKTSDNW